MKKIVLVLCLATMSFSLDHITTTYHHVSGAVVSAAGNEANKDTLVNGINRVIDTLVGSYPRWSWFSNHDSTFKWMNIDTIKGPVRMDSIKSIVHLDTARVDTISITRGLSSASGLFSSTVVSDSIYSRALSTIGCNVATLNASVIAKVDTMASTKGISATKGNFSSTVVVDSLKSTKGISATNGNFSDVIKVPLAQIATTMSVGGLIQAGSGEFSGVVYSDSIKSTKGISATIGRFSSSVLGTNATFSSYVSADSTKSRTLKVDSMSYFGKSLQVGLSGGSSTWNGYLMNNGNTGFLDFNTTSSEGIRLSGLGPLRFGKNTNAAYGSSTFTEYMRLKTDGTFGIGTTTPTEALTIKGNISDTGNITATGSVKAQYFTTNNEDSLIYEDTTFYDSLYDGTTYRARVQSRIVRCGAQVTVYQGALSGTITATTDTKIKGIPAKFLPTWGSPYLTLLIGENGVNVLGTVQFASSGVQFWGVDGFYLDAGVFTVYQFSFTWLR